MTYTPRTREEILRSLIARAVAESELTDVAEGSTIAHVLGTVAEEVERVEFQIAAVRDGYSFDSASGSELDQRVADLPLPGVARRSRTAASGSVLQITRSPTSGVLLVPAGTTFGRSGDPDQVYATTVDVSFADAEASKSNVHVVARAPGLPGNTKIGAIDRVVSGPSDIVSVINTAALTGGQDLESDDSLRIRAARYLTTLARAQPSALEDLALSFVGSDGSKLTHAVLWEDPHNRGYCELIVDDGTGMQGQTAAGPTVSGTAPAGGQTYLYFQPPAANVVDFLIDLTTHTPSGVDNDAWSLIEERGLIHLPAALKLAEGDTWQIDDYTVYTGLIAELQGKIEGDPADFDAEPGWRAAGVRVRVVPAAPQYVSFSIGLEIAPHATPSDVYTAVKDRIIGELARLAPGAALYRAKIMASVLEVEHVRNVFLSTPAADVYPADVKKALRTRTTDITVT